ncbi:MAG: NUDIX domain-containing protein [Alphaproteobacteria bacterium]|nr:NUDIX domain-containing protein [Alphaproteobacteria bacterium]
MVVRYLSFVFLFLFTLSSNLYAGGRGAGVLPMFDDGTVLLGKETRFSNKLRRNIHVWSDFGGAVDSKDNGNIVVTALREANEETAKTLKLTYNQVVSSPYTDHNHPSGGSYRMYYVKVHGQKPSIAEFHKNAKKLSWRSVEKSEWKYVPAQDLLKAVNAFSYTAVCPGTNEEIFAPTRAGLRQVKAHSVLYNLINSAKNKPVPVVSKKPVPVSKKVTIKKKIVKSKKSIPIAKKRKASPIGKKASAKRKVVAKRNVAVKKKSVKSKKSVPVTKKRKVSSIGKKASAKRNTRPNKKNVIQRTRSRR